MRNNDIQTERNLIIYVSENIHMTLEIPGERKNTNSVLQKLISFFTPIVDC